MRRAIGITAGIVGLPIIIVGLAIAIFADAETWQGPLIVGGGIAFLGLFISATGWLALRSR